jgi:hypothetical protein
MTLDVHHTTCQHCGQPIANLSPYDAADWRDRDGSARCATPDRDGRRRLHWPVDADRVNDDVSRDRPDAD